EVPPRLAHRARIGEVLLVLLVDEPRVRPQCRCRGIRRSGLVTHAHRSYRAALLVPSAPRVFATPPNVARVVVAILSPSADERGVYISRRTDTSRSGGPHERDRHPCRAGREQQLV